MRILDTSSITDTTGFPVKSGTLQHIQLAYKETLAALANLLVGSADSTNFYILWGCVNTGTGLNYVISAGAIYYNGEIFLVDGFTFTATSGQVAVGTITVTSFTTNADPVTFTDNTARNVHNIRKIVFASGASGSSDIDFSALLPNQLVLSNGYVAILPDSLTVAFVSDQAIFYASAPDNFALTFSFTNARPGCVQRLQWNWGPSKTITVTDPSGSVSYLESGSLTTTDSVTVILYAMYCGLDGSGNNIVSYNIKQI